MCVYISIDHALSCGMRCQVILPWCLANSVSVLFVVFIRHPGLVNASVDVPSRVSRSVPFFHVVVAFHVSCPFPCASPLGFRFSVLWGIVVVLPSRCVPLPAFAFVVFGVVGRRFPVVGGFVLFRSARELWVIFYIVFWLFA
jgi:hypothetical protein